MHEATTSTQIYVQHKLLLWKSKNQFNPHDEAKLEKNLMLPEEENKDLNPYMRSCRLKQKTTNQHICTKDIIVKEQRICSTRKMK